MSAYDPVNTISENALRVRKVDLSDIQRPITENLSQFRTFFRKSVKSEVFLLDQIVKYLLKTKGKELRPALVFLSARLCGQVNERTYVAATMIELLHAATLIHDDVVDEADERRGFMSINKIWKNKASVLLGDYLLAKGLLVALDSDEFELLKVLSTAVKRMSEGELRQLKASKLQNMTEDRYFKVISEKTASLISACCECGAISTGCGVAEREAMRDFGLNIGIAFQIRDDLFDFGNEHTGKTTANDIIERKMTLPVIYALSQVSFFERRKYRSMYRKHNKTPDDINAIIQFVREKGGVHYAAEQMNVYASKAISNLQLFPESDDRHNLEDLLHFVISRKK